MTSQSFAGSEANLEFGEIVRLAAQVCRVPMVMVRALDCDREPAGAATGIADPDALVQGSFYAAAVSGDDILVVEDAQSDERFRDDPHVAGEPHISFCAGLPLINAEGQHVGALCAFDREPRTLKREQVNALRWCARHVVTVLELRGKAADYERASADRDKAESALRLTASLAHPSEPIDTVDRWRSWPTVVTLVAGLLLTIVAARATHDFGVRGEQERYRLQSEQVRGYLQRRLVQHGEAVEAATIPWAKDDAPTLSDWREWMTQQSFKGIRAPYGVGFIEPVPRSQLQAFVAREKREVGEWFNVHPPPAAEMAYVTRWYEPRDAEQALAGFDAASTLPRRTTMDEARDQGRTLFTPLLRLRSLNREGFVAYAPVYRRGMPHTTVAERRAAHVGWTFASLSVADLVRHLPAPPGMRVEIYDRQISPSTLLFDTSHPVNDVAFRSEQRFVSFGRTWLLVTVGSHAAGALDREAWIVFAFGSVVTLLLAAMIMVLNSTRRRALRLADEMTGMARANESRVRSILDQIADAVIAFPAGGALEAFNPAAERLFGFGPADIVGCDVTTILPAVREAPADGTTMQTTATRSDGLQIPVELTVRRVPDDPRRLTVAVVRDISGRLADEERLRASEERYRDLFENSNDLIQAVDGDGRLLFANRAWFRTLGYGQSDLREKTMSDIIDADVAGTPELRASHAMRVPWCTRAASDATCGECAQCEGVETIFRAADGRRVHVEGNISCRFDPEGRPLSMRGIWRDISLRKRAERELRVSQERLESLIENADDVIYRCDAAGRFTFVNATAARISGYPKERMIGMSFLHLIRSDHREAVLNFYAAQLHDKAATTYLEFPVVTADGREVWLGQKVQPVFDQDEIVGYHGLARDVTDRRNLKDELVLARDEALKSAQLKSEFLATMSHEIRTPMNGVIGMIGLLLETDLTAEQRAIATTAQTSADGLLTIINDILDYSKIESGKLTFERNEFELTQVVDGAVDLLVEQARAKSLEMAVIIEENVPTRLRGDAGRLRQVLINLIGNAVKFTEKGVIIVLVTADRELPGSALLRFTISDTGIGIAPEDAERLFSPFVQADGSTTRRFGGTGLGLAICRQLVQQMNGAIGVNSSPGRGATFWFTAELEKQPEPRRDPIPLDGSPRILVVDEQEINAHVLLHQLSALGVRAEAVLTFDDAVRRLREASAKGEPFSGCIVELHLEEKDGCGIVAAAAAEGIDVPMILVTSVGRRREDIASYRAAGFKRVLMKPVRQSHLRDCLASVLGIEDDEDRLAPPPIATEPSHHRLRVLVAEDNRVNQTVVVSQLRNLGHSAVAVGNGLEAIAAIDEIDYDVVLMDCQMPEMDGYQATATIRMREGGKKLPIIAMTANAMAGDRERCLAAGMDDYIAKPFKVEQLSAALARVARRTFFDEPSEGVAFDPVDQNVLEDLRAIDPSNPDFVPSLIALYLEDTPQTVEALRRAIAEGDDAATWRTAHALKSACANLGAHRLVDLCGEIESGGRSGGSKGLPVLFRALEAEYGGVTAALQRHLQHAS